MEEKIKDILDAYSFQVRHISRGRGAYICETNQGLKLIKAYEYSPQRLEFEQLVKYRIRDRGYYYIDQFNANKDGQFLTMNQDEKLYAVRDWFEGKECDVKNPAQILSAVRQLAILHMFMCYGDTSEERIRQFTFEDAPTLFYKRKKELEKIYSYIRKKKHWNAFEKLFMRLYAEHLSEAEQAIQILTTFDYETMRARAIEDKTLCHGDFNYHHILMSRKYNAIVNFDRMHVDIQMKDFYQFLRKIMEKNNWYQPLGFLMIDTYASVRPISPDELYCLYAWLVFPEKFWKISNRYYNSRKSWFSNVNYNKLDRFYRQEKARKSFIDAYKYCFIF